LNKSDPNRELQIYTAFCYNAKLQYVVSDVLLAASAPHAIGLSALKREDEADRLSWIGAIQGEIKPEVDYCQIRKDQNYSALSHDGTFRLIGIDSETKEVTTHSGHRDGRVGEMSFLNLDQKALSKIEGGIVFTSSTVGGEMAKEGIPPVRADILTPDLASATSKEGEPYFNPFGPPVIRTIHPEQTLSI
jgi:hypothetical protein